MHCPAGLSDASVDDLDSNVLAVIHSIIASNFRISVSSSFQSVTHAAAELPAQKD